MSEADEMPCLLIFVVGIILLGHVMYSVHIVGFDDGQREITAYHTECDVNLNGTHNQNKLGLCLSYGVCNNWHICDDDDGSWIRYATINDLNSGTSWDRLISSCNVGLIEVIE